MFSYTFNIHNFITHNQILIWDIFNYNDMKILHLERKKSSLTLKHSEDR